MANTNGTSNGTVNITDHYKKVAKLFDPDNEPYYYCATSFLVDDSLIPAFHREDVVIDIGGGTGELAHRIWKHVGLKHPVLCVDPSEDMLVSATKKDGVVSVCATAEEFFLARSEQFDKVLMCACVHHFTDPKTVFTRLRDNLSDGGACIIITNVSYSTFFSACKEAYTDKTKPNMELFSSLGLHCKVISSEIRYNTTKTQWYTSLRRRFSSILEKFTDKEIEEGILELESEYPHEDHLEVCVTFEAFILTKYSL